MVHVVIIALALWFTIALCFGLFLGETANRLNGRYVQQ